MIFFFQAEDGIRDGHVTGVQTCALPIFASGDSSLTVLLFHPSAIYRLRIPPAPPTGSRIDWASTAKTGIYLGFPTASRPAIPSVALIRLPPRPRRCPRSLPSAGLVPRTRALRLKSHFRS